VLGSQEVGDSFPDEERTFDQSFILPKALAGLHTAGEAERSMVIAELELLESGPSSYRESPREGLSHAGQEFGSNAQPWVIPSTCGSLHFP
jgi:hypothetical protein